MLYLGSDHGGFRLKNELKAYFQRYSIAFEDVGTYTEESCDYPLFAEKVATNVQNDSTHRGVLICTSGVGMSIAANKFNGIYAARLTQLEEVEQAVKHNGINVLCLPGNLSVETAYTLIKTFLNTPIDESERHVRRRRLIQSFEK